MPAPLLEIDGLVDGPSALTAEAVLEHAVLDDTGRFLVPILDVLAIARVRAEAEVIVLAQPDGPNYALRIGEITARDDVFLHMRANEPPDGAGAGWNARLLVHDFALSVPVTSIRAMSFASFVGVR